jgi:hypothetical protein
MALSVAVASLTWLGARVERGAGVRLENVTIAALAFRRYHVFIYGSNTGT